MKNMQSLLSQISVISQKNAEILEASGGRFNMFRVLGVNHYETTHSAILAELLDPKGSHGLKKDFLEAFVKIAFSSEAFQIFDVEDAHVYTEYYTADGRVDILIEDGKGHAIIIENKIYAGDQEEQLKRYNKFAQNKYGDANYRILYLTLDGSEASENSSDGVGYEQLSFEKDIISWLDECVKIATRFPLVRETLVQYINHLKTLTNQDMNKKNTDEIVQLLSSSKENIEAAFTVFENIQALRSNLAERLIARLNEIAKELDIQVEVGSQFIKGEKYAKFIFKISKWEYFDIQFEFEKGNFIELGYMYKLRNDDNRPEESIEYLSPKFQRHNIYNKGIPCGWSYMTKYRNWDAEAFFAITTGEMKSEIKRIVSYMLEQAKDLTM